MAMRCVIVDDSPHFLEAATALLEQDGFAIVGVASTSADALRQVRELDPDVVLVDVELGTESGLELARRIHTENGADPSKVILISTHSEDDLAGLVSASPATAFLPKLDLSASAIREILRQHGVTGA